jgi:hypothetical protein
MTITARLCSIEVLSGVPSVVNCAERGERNDRGVRSMEETLGVYYTV